MHVQVDKSGSDVAVPGINDDCCGGQHGAGFDEFVDSSGPNDHCSARNAIRKYDLTAKDQGIRHARLTNLIVVDESTIRDSPGSWNSSLSSAG
jgi:hypothetical protein